MNSKDSKQATVQAHTEGFLCGLCLGFFVTLSVVSALKLKEELENQKRAEIFCAEMQRILQKVHP